MEVVSFVQEQVNGTDEYSEVSRLAIEIERKLNTTTLAAALVEANQPGNSSSLVQAVFATAAVELGFSSEKTGLFADYPTSALRPDFYIQVGSTGVLLEVERGKTTTNNMDLLDFWKCHLCPDAQHLFLAVPCELRHNPTMTPKNEFAAVVRRLGAFFVARNYTNVRSLHIFGY